ncbi:helix-turn-helix domain-containing protein [Aurantimonas sp. VKM B-3413]|uniref:helix-turn-helix domain-containing protein n=1 Tax=Aurantimonas sp. VKM B-3413 TaxID=2779401 RepID=UPI001E506144|nr:helix-turn-helix transcriptional regulator [Aurantimonas sp. VKM B-3413]MCB8835846.1 helix-turn-helix domain-containing protein [Aurantimonas sp. VKM B-3413]
MTKTQTEDAIDAAVGRCIRTFRLARGMSQADLARVLGVTFQQVQKYEKGTNRISASRLQQTAELFELPVAAFFDNSSASEIDDGGLTHFVSTRTGNALNRAFARISDREVRRGLIGLVEALAKDASTG